MRLAFFLALILVLCPVAARASSSTDLKRQIERLNDEIGFIRGRLASHGSPSARIVEKSVEFRVIDSVFPAAMARPQNNSEAAEIAMTSGFSLMLVYMSDVDIVFGKDARRHDCLYQYNSMVSQVYKANLANATLGYSPTGTPAPEEFARLNPSRCGDLYKLFPLDAQVRPQRDIQVRLALTFMYLHELGHIVLGHKQQMTAGVLSESSSEQEKMSQFLASAKRSREQERSADTWAVKEMMHLGAHPLEALPMTLISMIIATSGLDCIARLGLSHPDPADRLKHLIQIITDESARRYGPLPPSIQQLFSDALVFAERTTHELQCPRDD